MLHGAAPAPGVASGLSSPAEIKSFVGTARGMARRQEIDEFLARKARAEAAANDPKERLALPPPDDWTVPQETAAPAPQPQAPAGDAADFPTLDEPGRQAPAPVAEIPNEAAPPEAQSQSPIIPQPEEARKPPAPPNTGTARLKAMLDDPRSADEIAAEHAAERGRTDAVAAHGAADAQAPIVPQLAPPVGVTPDQTGVNPQPAPVDLKVNERLTPEAPLELQATPDVYAGAEHTGTPTPAQAEAGNYAKRHVRWNGLNITVETEAGQDRTGTGPDGQPW